MAYAEKPLACEGCPANRPGNGLGFVPPAKPDHPRLILVGQGPGESDAWNSKPFYHLAPTGDRLNKWLYRAGISRTQIAIGNLVQCWLPGYRKKGIPSGNREPTQSEMKWCWNAHVGPWLTSGEGIVVVPVGIPATKFLMGIPPKKGAEKFLGTLNKVELPPVEKNS
jgi:uracil-DNA glycosylase family 4